MVKNVWLMPNIKYTAYKENDILNKIEGYSKPKDDVYGN